MLFLLKYRFACSINFFLSINHVTIIENIAAEIAIPYVPKTGSTISKIGILFNDSLT